MLSRADLQEWLRKSELSAKAARIADLAEPSLQMVTSPIPYATIPKGISRLGGQPELPAAISWPISKEKHLNFLGQLNLEKLSSYSCCKSLPQSGFLWFFCDCDALVAGDRDSWRIVHVEVGQDELHCPSLESDQEAESFQPCSFSFHECWSLPGGESILLQPLDLTQDDLETLEEMQQDLFDMESVPEGSHHQLMGHPRTIQSDMRLECQLGFHEYGDGYKHS